MATQTSAGHRVAPQDLAALLGGMKGSHSFKGALLPLNRINVFPQPRKTFKDIEEFAQGLARNKLLNPITVAKFDGDGCERYLTVLNLLWRTSLSMRDAIPVKNGGRTTYFVLLAGERRYRGLSLLWEKGCLECQETFGLEPTGACFQRHFEQNTVEVRLCINISPLSALFLQLAENTHMPVPPHEEAHAYAELFKLAREADERVYLSVFARGVGRSPETIRNAIRFSELPSFVQEAVANGIIPYGIAIEIARLHAQNLTEEELRWWLLRAVAENFKVPDFRDVVTRYLINRSSGQVSLLDIMSEEQRKLLDQPHFRKVVEVQTIKAIWAWIYYFGKVLALFEEGMLGQEDSPFSERSPVKVFRRLLDHLDRVAPHMEKLLPMKERDRSKDLLNQVREIVQALDQEDPSEVAASL